MAGIAAILIMFLSGVFYPWRALAYWPTQQANYQRTGVAVDAGPEEFVERWNFRWVNEDTAVAVDREGVVYVNDRTVLYAINGHGREIWRYQADGFTFSPPSLGQNRAVYTAATTPKGENYLIAVDGVSGKEMWRKPLAGRPSQFWTTHVAIGRNGMIYATAADGISAFLPDGTKKWSYKLGPCAGAPGVSPDGAVVYVYSACKGGGLYALGSDGTLKWRNKTPTESHYSVLIVGPDGTVYLPDAGTSSLYAIGRNGKKRWKREFKGMNVANTIMVIGGDWTLYATVEVKDGIGGEGKLVAIDSKNGAVKWEFAIKSDITEACFFSNVALAIDKNGKIYHVAGDGNLYVFDAGGALVKKNSILKKINSPTVGSFVQTFLAMSGGVIYATGMDRVLYAIGDPLR